MYLKKGVKLLDETEGSGEAVQRQRNYVVAIRFTLNRGEVLSSLGVPVSFRLDNNRKLHDDGYFEHCARINRDCLIPGLFYAVQGMKIGGYRKVSISPHLAYGEKGIPGTIPPNARIIAEVKVLRKVEKR